jgi:hypothetical protein
MASHGWIRRLLPARRPPRRRALYGSRRTEWLECRTLLTAIVVTTPLDLPDVAIGDGIAVAANGETSLRAAVQEANALPGSDTIILPSGLFAIFDDLSVDATNNSVTPSSPLDVTDDLAIIGTGSAATVIDSGPRPSLLQVRDRATLNLGWLTLRSTGQAPVVVSSGEVIEIADVKFESLSDIPPGDEPDSSPSRNTVARTVSDLNASRARTAAASAVPPHQDTLLAELFSRQLPIADLQQLIIPQLAGIPQVNSPLDATLGISNPQPPGAETAARYEETAPPRIARSSEEEADSQKQAAGQRQEGVVNTLFETPSDSGADEVQPAGRTEPALPRKSESTPDAVSDDAAAAIEVPQPLFPELEIPPFETELPVIQGAAPFLPDLESDLPEIQIDEASTTQRRSSFLPVFLGGLLTSAVRYRSAAKQQREQLGGRADTRWATRVEALI